MTVISSVLAANEAGQAGAVFWAMDNGNHPDGADFAFLNPAGTQLTPVGVDIQPWLSQKTGTLTGGGTTPPVTTPPVTTPPVTTTNPVLIKPGVGSFKDTAGNVYTVAANGDADENGNLMNGGTATGALELAKGVIYGQDFATGTWYTWNQSTWTQAASAPPAITVTPPVTTPPVTTPPVTTPPVTTTNPGLIKPGVGSFKDTAGNVYTVAANGDADENGNLLNGGTATGAMELAKGIIYGQDYRHRDLVHLEPIHVDAGGLGSARHYRHPARHHSACDNPARHDDQSCEDHAWRWLVQGYGRQRLHSVHHGQCRRERQSDERWHRHRRDGTRQGGHLRPGLCHRDLVHLEPDHLDPGGLGSARSPGGQRDGQSRVSD